MLKKSWLHIKRHWIPFLFAYTAKIVIKGLLKTCKVHIQGLETFIETAEKAPCILMLWHNRLILVAEILNFYAPKFIYTAFISKSRDGDALALLTRSYSIGRALRVSHHSRHLALSQLIGELKHKGQVTIMTPDGPRGPRFVVKPGIVVAARETGANIFPFTWHAKHFWQLNTWDQMKIPKPFTTIEVVFGVPLTISKEHTKDNTKETSLLKTILDAL